MDHFGSAPFLGEDFKPQLGKAIAICNVVDCIELKGGYSLESCLPDTNGRWGFILEEIQKIEPFEVTGSQGFFYVVVGGSASDSLMWGWYKKVMTQ